MRQSMVFQTAGLALSLMLAVPAFGQVTVHVTDLTSGNPVPLAAVQSLRGGDALETQSTNAEGIARLSYSDDAETVQVMALGYATVTVVWTGASISVGLPPQALELDSIAVSVEATRRFPGRLQFSARRDEHPGLFLDPFDIGIKSKYGVVEVFRELEGIRRTRWTGPRNMPTIVSSLGSGCIQYRLNNLPVRNGNWNYWPLSSLLPQDVMAMEIYRFIGEVPSELRKDAWPPNASHPCGLVVIWTREAWE